MYLGIDSGKTGGLVHITAKGNVLSQYVMPLMNVKSKKKGKKTPDQVIDLDKLCELLQFFTGSKVVIEEVHALFGVDKGTSFKQGEAYGVIKAAVACAGLESVLIPPKQWQAAIWDPSDVVKVLSASGKTMVTDTKASSLNAATRLFPGHEFLYGNNEKGGTRRTVPHDGMVDAALIALYAKQHFS